MDLHEAGADGRRYDAVVGRRVLMYQPDPAAAVRGVARALDPGGLVVLQEHDATMTPARVAPLPLHDRAHGWVWRTVEREGADIHMGFHLASVLARSGLVVERVRAEAVVQTPTMSHHTGAIVRAMLPRIVRHGVATAEEIEVDTLDRRLAEERRTADATYVGELVFGAWARKPG
jgi:SAM-dependent methyltransferase